MGSHHFHPAIDTTTTNASLQNWEDQTHEFGEVGSSRHRVQTLGLQTGRSDSMHRWKTNSTAILQVRMPNTRHPLSRRESIVRLSFEPFRANSTACMGKRLLILPLSCFEGENVQIDSRCAFLRLGLDGRNQTLFGSVNIKRKKYITIECFCAVQLDKEQSHFVQGVIQSINSVLREANLVRISQGDLRGQQD